MKFLLNKFSIVIILVILFFAAGVFFQLKKHPWINVPKKLLTQTAGNNKQILYNGKLYNIIKQKKFSENQYSSPQMNISFIYPSNIKYKQINQQVVALYDPDVKDTDDNTLYIYSTTVPESSISFKIPFTIPGNLKATKIIKTKNYVANQEIYSDGKSEITFLILRQKEQTIVMRIPPNSNNISETIADVINSIKRIN